MEHSRRGRTPMRARLLAGCALLASALPAASQEAHDLGQIVVTAGGFEQALRDAPASVTVVASDELERGAFRDLTDALREVQGVSVSGPANERDISIRGLPGTYTLILVDGRRQSTRESRPNGSAGFEQSMIPPLSTIDRIEIVRGPMSSLYGSDAMGGVINIITRKPTQAWTGSVTLEGTAQQHAGHGASGQLSFHTSGPLIQDRLALSLWGRLQDRGEDGILDGHQARRETNLGARLDFTPDSAHDLWAEAGRTEVESRSTPGRTLVEGGDGSLGQHTRHYWALGHTARWGAATTELYFQQETGERRSAEIDAAAGERTWSDRVPRIRNSVLEGKLTLPLDWQGTHTLLSLIHI